ncbi:hypothetical protein [Mycobacterium sp. URHB0021]
MAAFSICGGQGIGVGFLQPINQLQTMGFCMHAALMSGSGPRQCSS